VARKHRNQWSKRAVSDRDVGGPPTGDPVDAASGETVELDAHGRPAPRLRLFLGREELPWLPVSEPAFLLWVLAALVVIWVGIAAYLSLA
jgi:hypothetical protein